MRRVIVCFAAMAMALSVGQISPAAAWQADGYRPGMTITEIRAVARSAGYEVNEGRPAPNTNVHTITVTTFDPLGRPDSRVLTLCRERLNSYARLISGGPSQALRIGTKLSRQYGPPTTQYIDLIQGDLSYQWLVNEWAAGTETVEVAYEPVGESMKASQTWRANNGQCRP